MKSIAPVENHRERETGVLVYPVYSRRSKGLSVGINLFPGKKQCPFNCPYCEVFPFTADAAFSPEQMEADLRLVINDAIKQNIPVRDLCFSGNGESSLSPFFSDALARAAGIRDALVPAAELVLISNGAGLLKPGIFSLLRDAAAGSPFLHIWIKLDAGTSDWYAKINRSAVSHAALIAAIQQFAALAPFTVQTMICAIDGQEPPPEEARAWEQTIKELAAIASVGEPGLRKVQIYGKARPAPEDPKAQQLPAACLEARAASLRSVLNSPTPVEVYP